MEFDKSRVFSAVNADELHEGDKVIVSNVLSMIKEYVKRDIFIRELYRVERDNYSNRFVIKSDEYDSDGDVLCYSLAYLVERKENCTNCVENGRAHGCIPMDDDKITRCFDYKPKTEKQHYRPFRDTDELIKVWCEYKCPAHNHRERGLTMPFIWVRSKFNKDHKGVLINNYFGEYVELNKVQCFLSRLFDEYTFLDGSPCGVEA